MGGYHLNEGIVKFKYDTLAQYLDIYNITLNGDINDIMGDIKLDFQDDKIDGNLQIVTLKDYATVINYIPLVNYLLLNKEGKFSIPVTLYGTIKDPQYSLVETKTQGE